MNRNRSPPSPNRITYLTYETPYQPTYETPSYGNTNTQLVFANGSYYQLPDLFYQPPPPPPQPYKEHKRTRSEERNTKRVHRELPSYAISEDIPINYIKDALIDVVGEIGLSYEAFSTAIDNVINNPQVSGSDLSLRVYKDRHTGVRDFWSFKKTFNISSKKQYYGPYSRREVLKSEQFYKCLRNFCKNEYRTKAYVKVFSGEHDRSGVHYGRLENRGYLHGENLDDYIMFVFNKNG